MTRLNKFVSEEELAQVRTAQSCSGMFLSGGMPMGDPQRVVSDLVKKYGLPEDTGLDLSNGEFVTP